MNDLFPPQVEHLCPATYLNCDHPSSCDLIESCLIRIAHDDTASFLGGNEDSTMTQKAQCIHCGETFPEDTEFFPLMHQTFDLWDKLGVNDYQCIGCITDMANTQEFSEIHQQNQDDKIIGILVLLVSIAIGAVLVVMKVGPIMAIIVALTSYILIRATIQEFIYK